MFTCISITQTIILATSQSLKMVTAGGDIQRAGRAEGPATILAIGTANPANCVDQSTYSDFYFRVTGSEHEIELKDKFKRICKI